MDRFFARDHINHFRDRLETEIDPGAWSQLHGVLIAEEDTRRWCPELAKLSSDHIHAPLSSDHIHAPFEAPPERLAEAGIRLGTTYPVPIADHGLARWAALAGYAKVRDAATRGDADGMHRGSERVRPEHSRFAFHSMAPIKRRRHHSIGPGND